MVDQFHDMGPSGAGRRGADRQRGARRQMQPLRQMYGLSLVELLVSIAISLFMIGALVALYVNSSAARVELDRASRQIENGRFAIDMMRDDISLAGYYGELTSREVTSYVEANPCATAANPATPTELMWSSDATTAVAPTAVQGPPSGSTSLAFTGCTASGLSQRANTGFLVVRRVRPEAIAANAGLGTAFYLQSRRCLAATTAFIFKAGTSGFTETGSNCTGTAPKRLYESRLYYVADCGVCSPNDGIPTLKMRELQNNTIVERVVADGIEDLQFEFGLDTTGDGIVDSYATSGAAADWPNVVAIRIHLISRATAATPGYADTKTYDRGAFGSYSPPTGATQFKRRSYTSLVFLPNASGPREAP